MYIAQKCSHSSDCWHVTEHPNALSPEDLQVCFSFLTLVRSAHVLLQPSETVVCWKSLRSLELSSAPNLFSLHVHRKPPWKLFKWVQDASWMRTFLNRDTSWLQDFFACLCILSSFTAVDLFATTAISDATYPPNWKNWWYGNFAVVDCELFIHDKLKQWQVLLERPWLANPSTLNTLVYYKITPRLPGISADITCCHSYSCAVVVGSSEGRPPSENVLDNQAIGWTPVGLLAVVKNTQFPVFPSFILNSYFVVVW